MFPYVSNYTSINSSSIEIGWYPSPNIMGIDLTQLSGAFTMTAYVGILSNKNSETITSPMTKLNETGKIVFVNLQADTIYVVRFQRSWQNSAGDKIIERDISPKLVRTYAMNKTTLNPIPSIGQYKWNQTVTSAGKSAVVVNASISLELPFTNRNITVTFGSQNQSYALNSSTEFAIFQFDQLDSQPKDYPLKLTFTYVDNIFASDFGEQKVTIIRDEIVRITPMTTTPSPDAGNRLVLSTIFYPIFLTMFFFLYFHS